MSVLIPILKSILSNKIVIGTAIAVFLYMDFASYVVSYRKKPPKQRKRRVVKPAAPKPPVQQGGGEGGAETEDTGETKTDAKKPAAKPAK